jgi:addiction module HigA family antidote
MPNKMRPIHPGEILKGELVELGLSANAFAQVLVVPANQINAIINEQRSITADTALRLSRFFGTTPEFWMSLQASHDVKRAKQAGWREIVRTVKPNKSKIAA